MPFMNISQSLILSVSATLSNTLICTASTSVRQMLGQRGIQPENLPAAEDIKKVERRVASNIKKIEKTTKKLPKSKP